MSDEARISEPAAQQRGVVTNESADHGVRTDVAPGEVRSRSADPGQSSYGGFRNEDPAMQHQADASKQDAAGKGGHQSTAGLNDGRARATKSRPHLDGAG